MFLRYLAGKLFEGHELFSKNFYGSNLSKKYNPNISDEAKNALKISVDTFQKKITFTKLGILWRFTMIHKNWIPPS
jgi:hypothetical protein